MKTRILATFIACCLVNTSVVFADQLYVLNGGSNNVSVIDTLSRQEIALIPVGQQPSAIALAPQTHRLYVANRTDNTVNVISTETNKEITSPIHVGSHPIGLFVTSNENQVYVLTEGTTSISVIDTATNSSNVTISIGAEPFRAAMAPHSQKLYVICYGLSSINVIDTTTHSLIDVIHLENGINPSGIAVYSNPDHPLEEVIYVAVPNPQSNYSTGNILLIDTTNHAVIESIPLEINPSSVTMSPNEKYALVINEDVYSQNVETINTKTHGVTISSVGRRPCYGIFSLNDMLYITNSASNTVTAINTQINEIVGNIPVGYWPIGGTIDSQGILYICNNTSGSVSVIDTNTNTVEATIELEGLGPTLIVP